MTSTLETITNHVLVGRPTKYVEKEHLKLLVKVFSTGEGIVEFCGQALIHETTFHNWVKTYPKFKYAYKIMLPIAQSIWLKKIEINPNINFNAWRLEGKNRFGYGNAKINLTKSTKPEDKIQSIWTAISKGKLSNDEINKLSSLVNTQVNIKTQNDVSDMASRTMQIKETLCDNLELIEELINKVENKGH
jgi:hypothetical protein